jgi:hypothetical protein
MKKLILLAALATVTVSQAQFVQGPTPQSLLTISTAFYVPGSTTTNIPTTLAPIVQTGRDGLGVAAYVSATNAASTTNATVILEPVAHGRTANPHTFTVSIPQNGTSGYEYFTNLPTSVIGLLNVPGVRVKSIQNTNTFGIFITNLNAYVR